MPDKMYVSIDTSWVELPSSEDVFIGPEEPVTDEELWVDVDDTSGNVIRITGLTQPVGDTLYVNLNGDLVRGNITIEQDNPWLSIDDTDTATVQSDLNFAANSVNRATIRLDNLGERLQFIHRDAAGTEISPSGLVYDLATGLVTLAGDPTEVNGISTKQYTDSVITVSDSLPTTPPVRNNILWITVPVQ